MKGLVDGAASSGDMKARMPVVAAARDATMQQDPLDLASIYQATQAFRQDTGTKVEVRCVD